MKKINGISRVKQETGLQCCWDVEMKCICGKSKSYFFLKKFFFTQAILRPHCPSSSSQNTASKIDDSLHGDGLWRGGDSSHIKSVIRYGPEWEVLPNSAKADRNHKRQTSSGKDLPDSEPPETILQSPRTQGHPQKMLKELHTAPSACQEGLQDSPQIPPADARSSAAAPSTEKETNHISERRNNLHGQELQTLLSRLLDAFDLDTPSGEAYFGFCPLSCVVFAVCVFV